MSDFVHLHCHTEYSLLDGAIRLKDLCARSVDFGMGACAITDHGNMYGAAYFYKACKEFGLNPIFGCEVYVCDDHRDKESERARHRNHLILLAETDEGYHNLVKLVSRSFTEGFYMKPRVDHGMIKTYRRGLICLSACIVGEIPEAILAHDMDKARALASEYADLFPGSFYLELQSNGLKEQEKVNIGLKELAADLSLPLVATNDCHYLNKEDYDAHEVLLCIGTKKLITDEDRLSFTTNEFYYKSPEEMEAAFADTPEAIANTAVIAGRCHVELDMGHHYFPVYPLPENASIESEFRRLAEEGLEKRLARHPNREHIDHDLYRRRLQHELSVILDMGFPGYFLIVQEFINWAKNHGIPVGPGRGSAAGSLVAWALRITNIDPIPYNLLFERFLNSERVSLPDIDVDFCERRRPEVIQHMRDTYGVDCVAQIITFGTMKARAVVRDVGRVLNLPLSEVDTLAKLIPSDPKMTIKKAMEQEADLKKRYESDQRVKQLFDTASCLEGLTRHASIHAAGLVVSDKPMEEYLPLCVQKDAVVSQFDGPMTEQSGLVKFDFLGLKTMTMIFDTLENIRREGKEVPDLDNLALDDVATYQLYSRGETDGVFQVESSGMRQYLRMLRPSCFEDIIAMLALYRPGPLGSGMVDEFIKRKHGQLEVTYPHPSLESCLKDTYGVIVYQEQVMQIAQIIASYTLGGADLLRRAMGKKKAEAMAQQRSAFLSGAQKNGISQDKANEIFDLMEKFAAYGFNKSHSAAYALVSYYTAYLKVHYPAEFMAALMSSEMGDQDKLLKYISCCKEMGIDVLPPLVNRSLSVFTTQEGRVIFGLGGIKNVGESAIESLIEARKQGPFTSLLDMCERVNQKQVNKRALEALIKAGACDCFEISRAGMLAALEKVISKAQHSGKKSNAIQGSLLDLMGTKAGGTKKQELKKNGLGLAIPEAELPEMDDEAKLLAEKEVLGLFLTSHPLQAWTEEIRRQRLMTLEEVRSKTSQEVVCAVLVNEVKEKLVKTSGKKMGFIGIEDLTDHGELVVFARDWETKKELFMTAGQKPLVLKAVVSEDQRLDSDQGEGEEQRPQELKLLLRDAWTLEEGSERCPEAVLVTLEKELLAAGHIEKLKEICERYKGSKEVRLRVILDDCECLLSARALNVRPSADFYKDMQIWRKKALAS